MRLLASDAPLRQAVIANLPGLDTLRADDQVAVELAVSDEMAAETNRLLLPPPIDPAVTVPWTCSRCQRVYTTYLRWAVRHAERDDCHTPRAPAPVLEDVAPLRPVTYGAVRRTTWQQQVLRQDLASSPDISGRRWPSCTACRRRGTATPCPRCFYIQWTSAAQDPAGWDAVVYGRQPDDAAVARRRRARWSPAVEGWADPRPAEDAARRGSDAGS